MAPGKCNAVRLRGLLLTAAFVEWPGEPGVIVVLERWCSADVIGAGSLAGRLLVRTFAVLFVAMASSTARAGPPFLTDDPVPTDTGHWEIYAPLVEASGRGAESEGSVGFEVNYGAAKDVQLTFAVPIAYRHDSSGGQTGMGDIELAAKYRFYQNEPAGFSIAAFPGITIPTATQGLGAGRVTAFLPIWAQKDMGPWSVFGGGGYAINPGAGNRNYWSGGIAVSRQVTKRLLLGLEADRKGADSEDGSASTSVGLGVIWQLGKPFRLLASGGPTFDDAGGAASYHAFFALGLDF
jgi:hypothetical protein